MSPQVVQVALLQEQEVQQNRRRPRHRVLPVLAAEEEQPRRTELVRSEVLATQTAHPIECIVFGKVLQR